MKAIKDRDVEWTRTVSINTKEVATEIFTTV